MKIKTTIGVLILVGALIVWLQFQKQKNLRMEIEVLHQQISRLQTDKENFSAQFVNSNDSKRLSDEQFKELLKLRGEVGLLRQRTNELGKLQGKSQPNSVGQNQSSGITPDERFQLHEWHVVNAMKELGLAMKIHAEDNNRQYATNFDQLKMELNDITNFTGNISLDTFEFMNVGLLSDATPSMIIFRERMPRVDSNNWWYRVYGLADGSVQTVYGGDQGNEERFEEFEKEHSLQTNQ